MKKKTFLAGAIAAAMAGAGMMGATAPQPTQATNAPQQMNRANQQQTPQQQPVSANEIKQFSQQLADLGKHLPTYYQTFSRNGQKWCDMGSSRGFNKVKHGRNARRKHRRQA